MIMVRAFPYEPTAQGFCVFGFSFAHGIVWIGVFGTRVSSTSRYVVFGGIGYCDDHNLFEK